MGLGMSQPEDLMASGLALRRSRKTKVSETPSIRSYSAFLRLLSKQAGRKVLPMCLGEVSLMSLGEVLPMCLVAQGEWGTGKGEIPWLPHSCGSDVAPVSNGSGERARAEEIPIGIGTYRARFSPLPPSPRPSPPARGLIRLTRQGCRGRGERESGRAGRGGRAKHLLRRPCGAGLGYTGLRSSPPYLSSVSPSSEEQGHKGPKGCKGQGT